MLTYLSLKAKTGNDGVVIQVCYTDERRTENSEKANAQWARMGKRCGKKTCNGHDDQEIPEERHQETRKGRRAGVAGTKPLVTLRITRFCSGEEILGESRQGREIEQFENNGMVK